MKRVKAPDRQHHAIVCKGLRLVEISRRHAFSGEFQVDLMIEEIHVVRSMTVRATTPQDARDVDGHT